MAVQRFVTHIAVVLVLILGAQPAAAAACQWACAHIPGESSGQASHHHHSTASVPSDPIDHASVRDSARSCDHQDATTVALRTTHFKLSAPAAIAVVTLDSAATPRVHRVTSTDLTHSPPGTRSAPPPLRI